MKIGKSDFNFFLRRKILLVSMFLFLIQFQSHAQWMQTNGPVGITINSFYDSGNAAFAGSDAKGVYRSFDHGVNWQAANSGIENSDVLSFTEDEYYLYAGTLGAGVYRSADIGSTWTAVNSGIDQLAVSSMATGGGYVFAGTIGTGVYRSSDQGMTWEAANGGTLDFSYIISMCYVGNRLIAEGDNYIYYSLDNGTSWNLDQGAQFYPISNFFVTNDTVYASAYGGVFYSYDGGSTWSDFISISSVFNHNILGFAKSNDTLFIGFADGMYFSSDHAQTWTQIPQTGLRFGNRFSHCFIRSGSRYLVGMDELGIYSSSDVGATWIQAIKGITPASTIDNCMINVGGTIWTGTHTNGIFRTEDNGINWTKIGTTNDLDSLSNGIIFSLCSPAPDVILAGTCGYGLYRSDDNGLSWTHITAGLPSQGGTGYLCVKGLANTSSNVMIATDHGLYYSNDEGVTWNASNVTGSSKEAVGIAVNDTIACAAVNSTSGSNKIYISSNGGQTWSSVYSTSSDDFICVASDDNSHFYAGSFYSNVSSADNGNSWDGMTNGIPFGHGGYTIKAIDNNVFVGDDYGVFWSSDYGASFSDANEGLDTYPNNAVQGLTANDEYLFAGLFHDAVWKRPLSDFGIGVATQIPNQPQKTEISLKNSPNPFTTITSIIFTVPQTENVSLQISDVTGKILFTRKMTLVPSGSHSIDFNGSHLASGIYFAKLQVNDEVKVLKMVLSK